MTLTSDYTPVRLILDADRKLSFAEYEEDNDEEPAQASKMKRAMEILEEMLEENGQAAVSEIHAIMADEGIGDKTAQRARRRLGAIPDNVDGVNVWRMPE